MIRFSLGIENTEKEITDATEAIRKAMAVLRS
jgi:cysteine sulfinate desulfinase/cysteine desulfurase-like protein